MAREMTRKQALRLAIQALEAEKHKLAVDANFADRLHATYPQAISASKKRKKIIEAIEILEAMKAEAG